MRDSITMTIPMNVVEQFQPNKESEARLHLLLHQILEGCSPGLFAYSVLKPIIELNKLAKTYPDLMSTELVDSLNQFMSDFNVEYTYED